MHPSHCFILYVAFCPLSFVFVARSCAYTPLPHELNSSGYGGYTSIYVSSSTFVHFVIWGRRFATVDRRGGPIKPTPTSSTFFLRMPELARCMPRLGILSDHCDASFSDSGYLETRDEVGKGWRLRSFALSLCLTRVLEWRRRMNGQFPRLSNLFGWLMILDTIEKRIFRVYTA